MQRASTPLLRPPSPEPPISRSRSPLRGLLWLPLLVLLSAAAGGGPEVHRASTLPSWGPFSNRQVDPYDLKAGYLANFAKYADWPRSVFESKTSPVEVLLIGKEPRLKAVQKVLHGKTISRRGKDGKSVPWRKLNVRIVKELPETKALHAHIILADGVPAAGRRILIDHCAKRPVLLVGDSREYFEEGGTMGFFPKDRRIVFGVNLKALKQAGLKMSAHVLQLAAEVKR